MPHTSRCVLAGRYLQAKRGTRDMHLRRGHTLGGQRARFAGQVRGGGNGLRYFLDMRGVQQAVLHRVLPVSLAGHDEHGQDEAGGAHVRSEHFKNAQKTLPQFLARTPKIVNMTIPQDDWSLLGEMAVPNDR